MKIYLAAYETAYTGTGVVLEQDYNVFVTYYYRPKTEVTLKMLKPSGHKGLITVDSGAHSFFAQNGVSAVNLKAKKKNIDPDIYFDDYIKWVKAWFDYFDYFVELDIQELVGQPKVDSWRKRIHDEGLASKCIMVHHSCNTDEEFYKLLDLSESKYIGLEGPRNTGKRLQYSVLLKECYERQIKVHGFALIKYDFISKFPFYSVDSSSWTACNRYGTIQVFKDGRITAVKASEKTFKEHRISPNLLNIFRSKDHMKEKLLECAKPFKQLQIHITRIWEQRGIFWKD